MANGQFVDVALSIVRRDRLWLVDRRAPSAHLGGLWEFPGGKVLPGETVEEAAVRECMEEVGLLAEAVERLEAVEHDFGGSRVRLHPVLCRCVAGTAIVSERAVAEVRWVDDETLASLDMPAPNRAIVDTLLARGRDERG